MGRFNVGQEYVFFQIKIEQGKGRFGSAYCPWLGDKLKSVSMVVLTCTEEHAVTNGGSEEKDCKGYFFKDQDGNAWVNQYPTASYGQLDDTADGYVRRWFKDDEITKEDADAFLKTPDGQIWDDHFWHPFYKADRLMRDVDRGFKHVPEHTKELEAYLEFLHKKLQSIGWTYVRKSIFEASELKFIHVEKVQS